MKHFDDIYTEESALDYSSSNGVRSFTSLENILHNRHTNNTTHSISDLNAIQTNFHRLIHYRCRRSDKITSWLANNEDELPKITNELLQAQEPQWISIPGMYGGFSYGLIERDGKPLLITDSWVRIVGGSGQRQEITPDKVEMTARGFV